MIETKEEYAQTWALINGQDRQVAKDFHATIEALREVARAARHATGSANNVPHPQAGQNRLHAALDKIPDWIVEDG